MSGVRSSVARQYTEFFCAIAIGIGVDLLSADDRAEVEQPLLAEEADVQIHAIQRTERPDRVGAVLEYSRRPDGARRGEKLRQRIAGRNEVVELPVVQFAALDRFLAPLASPAPCAAPR